MGAVLSDGESAVSGITFRKNLRVSKSLFRRMWQDMVLYDACTWSTKRDAIGREGIRGEVKVLMCLRLLGHARSLRDLDGSAQMGKETIRKYFHLFCVQVRDIYGPVLLKKRPTKQELQDMSKRYGDAGFLDALAL